MFDKKLLTRKQTLVYSGPYEDKCDIGMTGLHCAQSDLVFHEFTIQVILE